MTVVIVTVVIVNVVIVTVVIVTVLIGTVVIVTVVIVTVVIVTVVIVTVVMVVIVTSLSKNNSTHRQPMQCSKGSVLRFSRCFYVEWFSMISLIVFSLAGSRREEANLFQYQFPSASCLLPSGAQSCTRMLETCITVEEMRKLRQEGRLVKE